MKVSPVDVGRTKWSPFNLHKWWNGVKIGDGKFNTESIILEFTEYGKKIKHVLTGNAAQLCGEYSLNGYKDWYFPSKDELNELYKSVKQYNIGGFNPYEYWCSSQPEYMVI